MVVGDVNHRRTLCGPAKDNAHLLVDSNRIVAFKVASERLEPIAGRNPKVIQCACSIQLDQFP